MAAAAIPIIEAIAPTLINLIASLVHKAAPAAETALGPGTGPVKFADVFASVMNSLNSAAMAGQIDKTLPNDNTVKIIIQAVVSSMNLSGLLSGTAASASAQSIALSAGQSVTITVK